MSSFITFSQNLFETISTWVIPSLFRIGIIIAVAFFFKYLLNTGSERFFAKSRFIRRGETLRQIISSTGNVVIISITGMMILNELGFDIRPIIASAGLLGVAFSLGAQNVMKDVINGFLVLLEDQFSVGDIVKIGDHSGTVEKMNLRTTILKDSNGNIHVIPNSEIKQITVLKGKSG